MKNLCRVLIVGLLGASSLVHAAFPEQFSWRNWHGSNWVTFAKDQHVQGPCNIFAGVALTESVYGLYYNRTGLKDLAEEHLNSFSCMQDAALVFDVVFPKLKNSGVVNETCVPYPSESDAEYGGFLTSYYPAGATCSKPCGYPNYKIHLGDYEANPDLSSNTKIKRILMHRGPIAINMNGYEPLHNGYPHAYLIIGWEERSDGLYWQLKDSWPDQYPRIYHHKFDHTLNLAGIYRDNLYHLEAYVADVSQPVKYYNWNNGWTRNDPSKRCTDRDGDGYKFWGLGSRPSGCSGEADSNDGDPRMGPFDAQGGVTYINEPVPVSKISISRFPSGSTMCPDRRYWLTAYVDGDYNITGYQWQVSWHATPVTSLTGSSSLQIDTYPDSQFGRVEYAVRVKNQAGWSDYKNYVYYRGWDCDSGGW